MSETTTTTTTDDSFVNLLFAKLESGSSPDFEIPLTLDQLRSSRNDLGETFLHVAAKQGIAKVIPHLVTAIDVDETDNDGWTPLLDASHRGHVDVVRVLLRYGANIDMPDLMGWTPLLWATYKNRQEIVELLLRHGADVNVVGDEDRLTPLLVAAGRGYEDIVQVLLSNNAKVNACDKFGSTALIWAARRGFLSIVVDLLNAGIYIDAVGMQDCSALIMATKGNYGQVVEAILACNPNVDIADQNGYTALAIAAREGYADIVQTLLQSNASVNTTDNFGSSVLSNAVRSGNIKIVRMLLEKHVDVNTRDSDNRTALHLAIDKSYVDIAMAILERKPNLEIKNKEGDSPLLRAVKNKDMSLCQMLVNNGAKIGSLDNAGDNPLHIAIRAKSTRLVQILLTNPSDSKLLYRPNKKGETPYSIDQENVMPLLPSIFGTLSSDMDWKSMLGYDAYSDILADISCKPNLYLPLSIGLFAKWGSGKSLLLPRIQDAIKSFSRSWLDNAQLSITIQGALITLGIIAFLSLSLATVVTAIWGTSFTYHASIFGFGLAFVLCVLYLLNRRFQWWIRFPKFYGFLARKARRLKLVYSVLTSDTPERTPTELASAPVSFLFAGDHRLFFVGGSHALVHVVKGFYESAEQHFGFLAVRLFSAFRTSSSHYHIRRLRTLFGIPVVVYFAGSLTLLIAALMALIANERAKDRLYYSPKYYHWAITFFTASGTIIMLPAYIIVKRAIFDTPINRMKALAHRIHVMPFERLIQKLQREVDALVAMIRTLDAFTNSQTRLVVIIDGLDNCEPKTMIKILDSVVLFFTSRPGLPFIVILAFDSHVIVNAINENAKRAIASSGTVGYEYLKRNINMPFYLNHTAVKSLQLSLRRRCESQGEGWGDTFRKSVISLKDQKIQPQVTSHPPGSKPLSLNEVLASDPDISQLHPVAALRIVHSIALTARLLKTYEIEFEWGTLFNWIAMIEQWPFRTGWILEKASEAGNENKSFSDVYNKHYHQFPTKHALTKLDRSTKSFEKFLKKNNLKKESQLTYNLVGKLIPCTSSFDPFLLKLISAEKKDFDKAAEDLELESRVVHPAADSLFADQRVWSSLTKPLARMSVDEVVNLIDHLPLSNDDTRSYIVECFTTQNITGLVLQTCSLADLQRQLEISLGDWTLIKLFVEIMRSFVPRPVSFPPQPKARAMPQVLSRQSESESVRLRRRMISIKEEEIDSNGSLHITPPASDSDSDAESTNDESKDAQHYSQESLLHHG